jgi:NADPH2:quinone reductase
MKAVIAHRDGEARVVELDAPPLGENTVKIRVSHCALGLPEELGVIATVADRLQPGMDGVPIGGMVSGIVEESGPKVRDLKTGLRVAAFGHPYVYHATQLSVPASLVVELPKKVNQEEGAFTGLGGAAIHMIRESGCSFGESILVFGAGMMGIVSAQVARAAGITALLADEAESRLTRARNVGLPHVATLDRATLVKEVDALTHGQGADAVVLTSDAPATAMALASLLLRPGGRICIAPGFPLGAPTRQAVAKELQWRVVAGAGPGHGDPHFEQGLFDYPRRWTIRENMLYFLTLLAERKVQISPLIIERAPLERATALYEKIRRTPEALFGAVLSV